MSIARGSFLLAPLSTLPPLLVSESESESERERACERERAREKEGVKERERGGGGRADVRCVEQRFEVYMYATYMHGYMHVSRVCI
jgi:hypothetical protein